jgi:hypothetical protein
VAATVLERILVASLCLAMLITSISALGSADDEEYELDVNVDDTKVCLVSGNFSVAITLDWPRVIFKHEYDPFSPTFEVSCPKMYFFNDTNWNGIFDPPEAVFTVFLDSNHVDWSLSALDQGYSDAHGRYAVIGMDSSIHAYVVGENETLVAPDWATLSFWFFLAEKPVTYERLCGTYVIDGKTEMRMNFTLHVNDYPEADGIVVEQLLKGGASTNMFQLVEGLAGGGTTKTEVSALVDERVADGNYSHEFFETSDPVQKTRFAKEDGVVQAFYFWETDAMMTGSDSNSTGPVNSSYFTTGAGMILHSILPTDNCTVLVSHDSTMGIYESGFVGSVRDWILEYIVVFTVACVAVALASLILIVRRIRRKTLPPSEEPETHGSENR